MSITSVQGNNRSTFRNTDYNKNGFASSKIYPDQTHLPADIVEISSKKQGFTPKQKCITFAAAAGILAATVLLIRGNIGAANKKIKTLAEHIDFIPAKTSEEAINFAKTNLGIKKYNKDMPLDVMNWVNEGLVNVNNAAKGKAVMPKSVKYVSAGSDEIAAMNTHGEWLEINKNFVDNIDESLKNWIDNFGKRKILFKNENNKFELYSFYKNRTASADLLEKINQFTEKPKSFSLNDKIEFYEDIASVHNSYISLLKSPMSKFKQILKNEEVAEVLLAHGKLPDLKQIEKLTTKQQRSVLFDLVNLSNECGIPWHLGYAKGDKFNTIYHEMGHLQHSTTAGEKLFLEMLKPEECKYYSGKVSDITDNFINSQEKQQIANLVSAYAAASPAEFVAETYSLLIQKSLKGEKKLSDKIMKLYAEYKGPSLQ